jgi:hypothetical protein
MAGRVKGITNALGNAARTAANTKAGRIATIAAPLGATGALGAKLTSGSPTGGTGSPATPTGSGVPNALSNMFTGGAGATGSDQGSDILSRYYEAQNNPAFYTMSGGPNQALIADLMAKSKAKLQQYKENRADAENMYGQLTSDVEGYGTDVQTGYQGAIDSSGKRATDYQAALSTELGAQEQRRSNAFRELGIEKEGALTDYGSTSALNQAMGNILADSNSWQGLLSSRKEGANARNKDLLAAVGNQNVQTQLGMKEAYDYAKDAYDSQISTERSKTATKKLNELGKMMTSGVLGQLKDFTFGGGTTGNTSIEKKIANWNAVPGSILESPNLYKGGPALWYQKMYELTQQAYSKDAQKSGKGIAPDLARFAVDFGLLPAVGQDYTAMYGNNG